MTNTTDESCLDNLCQELAARAEGLEEAAWPSEQLERCAQAGVFGWFVPRKFGGQEWNERDLAEGWLRLAEACLTTTFILTQWAAACRRIVASENGPLKARLLPDLAVGRTFTTVGISHLTTSRRHVATPVLTAREEEQGYVLNGYTPWVTGAVHAQWLVVGAVLADGRQLLAALDRTWPGVECGPPERLIALGASHTGVLKLNSVHVPRDCVVAGPVENVLGGPGVASTGGLTTSALAIGLAAAAVKYLEREAALRPDLAGAAAGLAQEQAELRRALLAAAGGAGDDEDRLKPGLQRELQQGLQLRAKANSLALRSTQAALAAAKGAGFVAGHPAGRWAREALFFLVWSCPQPVMAANLCELAGL